MGLGTNHVTTTTSATFIPEVWSDEIIAAYKKNLVAANLVKKMNFCLRSNRSDQLRQLRHKKLVSKLLSKT